MAPAQAFTTSYAPRLRQYQNAFIAPNIPTQVLAPASRTTKRGTTIINYADDAYDDDDFDDSEGQRRPTGLRSLRREDLEKREAQHEKLGKEIQAPVDVQEIYREWITRKSVKPTTDQQLHIQAQLPLTLIPIRIDLDIPAFQPDAPYPLPQRGLENGINASLPQFRRPEPAPPYKLRDTFLWNLHESLLTPDDFAITLVKELDLPNQVALAMTVSSQIRAQLEDYAGVALHPLFHSQFRTAPQSSANTNAATKADTPKPSAHDFSRDGTPRPFLAASPARNASLTPIASTPAPSTPQPTHLSEGNTTSRELGLERPIELPNGASVTALGTMIPTTTQTIDVMPEDPYLNPDDTYRCLIQLSISLSSHLFTDKFEWSLLHPPGLAEVFARQTCADMGLGGEWVVSITHAIYEAVLRLKKEACESGMLHSGGGWGHGEIDNQAVRAEESAGWRYDADDFGAEWEPKIEVLSKEDIEKREGDRERQLRRLRRETARFSSTTGMMPTVREQEAQARAQYFDNSFNTFGGDETPMMGRGERTKKKRRFRSLSPVARAVNSPSEGVNGAGTGWGGTANQLTDYEKQNWRCKWCLVWGSAVWAVRDGPAGPRTLCNNCGLLFERDKKLPVWSRELHRHAAPVGSHR